LQEHIPMSSREKKSRSAKALWQIQISKLIHRVSGSGCLFRIHRSLLLCAMMMTGFSVIWAQEPATSLDHLNLVLAQGDKITLIDASGNKITGRFNRLLPDGLDLNVNNTVRTFAEREIRQITRNKQDSPLNGFLIGAGVGFGSTLPLNLSLANHNEKGLAVAASAIWGLIGGGIGALVDACVHGEQLIYFRPRDKVTWDIRPLYFDLYHQRNKQGFSVISHGIASDVTSGSAKGVQVSVRF
jgi:hypothetical protein